MREVFDFYPKSSVEATGEKKFMKVKSNNRTY